MITKKDYEERIKRIKQVCYFSKKDLKDLNLKIYAIFDLKKIGYDYEQISKMLSMNKKAVWNILAVKGVLK